MSYSSSISYSPFSILFLNSKVLRTGISLMPEAISPIAILFETEELSKAKSEIYSPLCLKSSIPVPKSSFVKVCEAEIEDFAFFSSYCWIVIDFKSSNSSWTEVYEMAT